MELRAIRTKTVFRSPGSAFWFDACDRRVRGSDRRLASLWRTFAKARAVEVVAKALRIPQDLILVTGSDADVRRRQRSPTSRAYPFWKMVVARREYFVDQAGKFYDHISKGKGGS